MLVNILRTDSGGNLHDKDKSHFKRIGTSRIMAHISGITLNHFLNLKNITLLLKRIAAGIGISRGDPFFLSS